MGTSHGWRGSARPSGSTSPTGSEPIVGWSGSTTATSGVSADDGPADCVLGGDRGVFDAIVGGRMMAMAALLLGVLAVDGDLELLVLTRRPFPGPTATSYGRNAVAGGRRTS